MERAVPTVVRQQGNEPNTEETSHEGKRPDQEGIPQEGIAPDVTDVASSPEEIDRAINVDNKRDTIEASEVGRQPWVGVISPPDRSGASWGFEMIRHVDIQDAYVIDPLDGPETVCAMLDFQQRCTLLRPRVLTVDPGKVGSLLLAERTRIVGEFDALLSGLPVVDVNTPSFVRLSFDSGVFAAWYGAQMFGTKTDPKTRACVVETKSTESTEVILPKGKVTCNSLVLRRSLA